MNLSKTRIIVIASGIAAVASPLGLAAEYLGSAYEGFDYSTEVGPPENLDGQLLNNDGGTGFNAVGDASANTTLWGGVGTTEGSALVVASSIAGGVGSPVGNRAEISAVGAANGRIHRSLGQSVDSGTIYFSYLTERNNASQRSVFFSLYTGATEKYAVGQIGQGTAPSVITSGGTFAGRTLGTNVFTTGTAVDYGTDVPHLVIGRVDFDASGTNERVRIYLDPDDLSSEEALTPYLDSNTTNLGAIDGFRVFAGGSTAAFGAGSGDFDEIYFGKTFASVTGGSTSSGSFTATITVDTPLTQATITWPSVAGETYDIFRSVDLVFSAPPLATNLPAALGAQVLSSTITSFTGTTFTDSAVDFTASLTQGVAYAFTPLNGDSVGGIPIQVISWSGNTITLATPAGVDLTWNGAYTVAPGVGSNSYVDTSLPPGGRAFYRVLRK